MKAAALAVALAACGNPYKAELERNRNFECNDRAASYMVVGSLVAAELGVLLDCREAGPRIVRWTVDGASAENPANRSARAAPSSASTRAAMAAPSMAGTRSCSWASSAAHTGPIRSGRHDATWPSLSTPPRSSMPKCANGAAPSPSASKPLNAFKRLRVHWKTASKKWNRKPSKSPN